jgi:hypothetical protein
MFEGNGSHILLGGMIRNHHTAVHNGEVADEWKAVAKKAQAEVARLNEAHAISESGKVGALAQVKALREALKQVAPNHSLLADSGQRFSDGRTKSRIRLIFDQAFDAFAVQCGLSNPASIRDKW